MRIFMSHHSSSKPLVREVRQYLPKHVDAWIDEHELLAGENLASSIRAGIKTDVDFLVLFLDARAARSVWVATELKWALEEERRIGRPFIVPILLDDDFGPEFDWLTNRLCLRCHGYNEGDVRHLADELSSALFAWLSRDLDALRAEPAKSKDRLLYSERADALLEETAATIRRIVFPYRRDHQLALTELVARLHTETDLGMASVDELHALLYRLRDRKMISGIALTGRTIFIGEEHLNWRSQEALAAKRAAADFIVDQIQDGNAIYLDAGSSTLAVCKAICRGVRFGQWHHLMILTNSVPLAAELSDLANELGLDEEDAVLSVVVSGGRMRLNTSALVESSEVETAAGFNIGFDMAVIGTNGVSLEYGCTTTVGAEALGKRRALTRAKKRYIMAEPSKYGVWQSERFANFDDELIVVTAVKGIDPSVTDLAAKLVETNSRVEIVQISDESSIVGSPE